MTDWKKLEHAYGPAEDLPEILKELNPDREAPVWTELWGRVCHDGTTYSASPAILPFLLQTAAGWAPSQRAMALALAGAIVNGAGANLAEYRSSVDGLRLLALDTLKAKELSRGDRVYVMQAVQAMENERLWGRVLDGLNHGEFSGLCEGCKSDLYVVVGEYGCFCTTEEWVGNPEARRVPIVPEEPAELAGAGRWLFESCAEAGDPELAKWMRCLFGSSKCPACDGRLDVAAAIAAMNESTA